MRRLTVLYDSACGFCIRCGWWLAHQPQLIELELLQRNSPIAETRFGFLEAVAPTDELVVVGDNGAVYWGGPAYLMCLYALERYREWSLRLAHPTLLPFAQQAFAFVSEHRRRLSTLMDWLEQRHAGSGNRTVCETCQPCALLGEALDARASPP